MEDQSKPERLRSLESTCIGCIVRNMKIFVEEYRTGTSVPKKHFEFLQRTHSKELLNVLVYDEENLLLFRDFVLNPYIKDIDLSECSFSRTDIQLVIQQVKSIGETVKLLSIAGNLWRDEDLIDLMSSLPNVESLILRDTRTSKEVLRNVQRYCEILQKLNLAECEEIDDIALEALCTKDENINMGNNSSLLFLDVTDTAVTIDGVAFILKNFSKLKTLNHDDVCQSIYDSHHSDLKNNSLSDVKYSLTELEVKRPMVSLGHSDLLPDPEFLLNALKICSVVCPNLSALTVLNVESQAEVDACSEFHNLEEIYFNNITVGFTSTKLTATPFVESNGKNLTVLVVSHLGISGESVLKCCPKLQSFVLRNSVFEPFKVSKNDNLSYLLPYLKELHIEQMDFSDEVLAKSIDLILSAAANLEIIRFNSVENLTLDFVRSIAKHKCMSTVLKVDVSFSKIQFPVAREILDAAPNLENFEVTNCSISEMEYENLLALRDDVNIVWEPFFFQDVPSDLLIDYDYFDFDANSDYDYDEYDDAYMGLDDDYDDDYP